jgi:FlaA1/EpsC-like NDP-sugar epimerase
MNNIWMPLMQFPDKVLKQRVAKMLLNRYANRWLILLIDLFLSTFAFVLSYWVMANVYHGLTLLPDIKLIGWNFLLCTLSYLLFRTYQGVIRYSTYHEIGRITAAVLLSNLALWFLVMLLYPRQSPAVLLSLLMKNGMVTFFILVYFRYIIVRLYQYVTYSSRINTRSAVFMYGIDTNSVGLANMLNNNIQSGYKIIGFMAPDSGTSNQRIMSLPVFFVHDGSFGKLVATYKPQSVIFPTQGSLLKEKEKLVEVCIKHNIKILLARSPKTWNQCDTSDKKTSMTIQPIQIEDLLGREEIQINLPAISQEIKDKVVLITGAAGSIGSELVLQIVTFEPKMILLFDIAETPLYQIDMYLKEHYPRISVEAIIGDVRNTERLEQLFQQYRPQIVYHAAAYKHVPMMENHPSEAVITNILGTRNVANYALKYNADKFIMISTDKAVNPTNVMGASKRIAEIYVQSLAKYIEKRDYKTHFITTRFGNVLGSSGSVIPRFKEQIEKGGPLTVTDPNIIRYFMTIPEACRLVLEASVNGENGEIYIFDMGEPVKIDDLARNMIRLAGLVPGKDIQIIYTGLRPGEKLYEELLAQKEFTRPAFHPKIMIALVRQIELREVTRGINELIVLAKRIDTQHVVLKMKELVPEFISKNSIFSTLDCAEKPSFDIISPEK